MGNDINFKDLNKQQKEAVDCSLGNKLIFITRVVFSVEDFGFLGMGNPFVETFEAFHCFNQGGIVTLVPITALL